MVFVYLQQEGVKYRKPSSDFGEALRDYSKDITLQSWTKGVKETGRCMHEQIKKHDRDIRLSRTQTIAGVFEHDEVKFVDREPHWYSRRIEELFT